MSWNTEAGGGGDAFDATTPVTDDITVYAQWTQDSGPDRSGGSPHGNLGVGTTGATLSLSTVADATCKFSTVPNTAYADPSETTFTTTGSTAHSYALTGLTNGTTYNYYVRCSDSLTDAVKIVSTI